MINNKKPVLKDVLLDCPKSDGYEYNKKYDIMKLIPEGGCWVDLPIDKQKEYLGNSYYSQWRKKRDSKKIING